MTLIAILGIVLALIILVWGMDKYLPAHPLKNIGIFVVIVIFVILILAVSGVLPLT